MKAVGIDLGTTNCALAHVDEFERPVIVPNSLGETTTPSVICFRDGEILFGADAKELQGAGAPDVVAFFKRQMGVAGFALFAGGREHSATDLSALLLGKLKADAEAALGSEITHAVITVPAYFRNPQREGTIEAGRRAGFEVLQVINEPTAAAIAYGIQGGDRDEVLLVYDLGGGTFDVTLLRLERGQIRVLTSDGDHELGGKDWDSRIVEFLGDRFEAEFGNDPFEDADSAAELLVAAEAAKQRLSSLSKTTVSLTHAGNRGRYELDRATFEDLTEDLLARTLSFTERILADQKIAPEDLSGVLLVGGSTRMVMVKEALERRLGLTPREGVNVDEAVALGAAITAEQLLTDRGASSGRRLKLAMRALDVTNHSLGMIALNEDRSAYVNSIILRKDTELPSRESRPYLYLVRGRPRDLEVYMTQGEADTPDAVTYLGKYVIRAVPPAASGAQVVAIEYSYDSSGTVHVEARVKETGEALAVDVEPLPGDVPKRFMRSPEETAAMEHSTIYLAFDLSGSMSGPPLEEAQRAAIKFLGNLDLAHTSMGLCIFADGVQISLEACQNARRIEQAIDELTIGSVGIGNATDPFRELYSELKPVEGRRLIVALADGVWSCQQKAVLRAKACHEEGIEVIAVGFGSADEAFLRQIASSEENSLFTSVGELVETFSGIAQVITESSGGLALMDGAKRPTGLLSGLLRRTRE